LTGTELSLADCGFAPSFAILDCLQGVLGFDLTLPTSIKPIKRHYALIHRFEMNMPTMSKRWMNGPPPKWRASDQ
jgi:hypothetical protein